MKVTNLSIASFLDVNLIVVKRSSGKEYFNLTAKSRKSLKVVINYFKTYPLFSSKYLDYKDWEKVVHLILSQTHYEGIKNLKGGINNKRRHFNWDHIK